VNAVLVHLEKVVFGSACVAALGVVLWHLSEGSRLRREARTVGEDVAKLDAALKNSKAPAGASSGAAFVSAAPALAALTGAGATLPPTSAWAFHRRPTLRGKAIEPPDLRKDLLPPADLAAKVEDFTVILAWAANGGTTAAVQAHRVYRYPAGGTRPEKPVAEVPGAVRKWEDADAATLQPGSSWTYEVTAVTADETKQGGPESASAGPVTAALPYDRRLDYYGATVVSGKLYSVQAGVRRFAKGDWRGPEEFTVKPGEAIGGKRSIEIDGERVELDFAAKWTLKAVEQGREETMVDGQPRVVEKDVMVVVDGAGVETRIPWSEKPRPAVTAGPRTPFDAELMRLLNERNAARGAGEHETAMRIGLSRDWLSMKRARYLRGQTIVTERVEADIADFTAGIETLAAEIADLEASGRRSRVPGLQRKKSDDEAKLAILQNLVKK